VVANAIVDRLTLFGVVREAETGLGVPGLHVKAFDADVAFDDLLGSAVTAADGTFEIVSKAHDFRDFFERRPDLYLRVLAPDGKTEIWSTEDAVRWGAGGYEAFDVQIPRERLGELATRTEVELLGDHDQPLEVFAPGESLTVRASGLRRLTPHRVRVAWGRHELFVAGLMSDRHGKIEPTVVWPLMGLEEPRIADREPIADARRRWHGREVGVTLLEADRVLASELVRLDAELGRPVVIGSDAEGRVLHGFEAGDYAARITLVHPPSWDEVRVWIVPNQHDWRLGDPIKPITLANGREAVADVVELGGDQTRPVIVAGAEELEPGAYDFVVRHLGTRGEDDDDMRVRADDLVGGRRTTGLAVREQFRGSNRQRHVTCRRVEEWPYLQRADTFEVGEDVYAVLDPQVLDPQVRSRMAALYVVAHRTEPEHLADPSLQNLDLLGGNPGVPRCLTQSGCVNVNLRMLWPNAREVGEYDVVVDFGNNSSNAQTFVPDDRFDPPLDLIDGGDEPGFRIVPPRR
jgi:hypothetical protein